MGFRVPPRCDPTCPTGTACSPPGPGRPVVGRHDRGAPLLHPAVAFRQLDLHLVGERMPFCIVSSLNDPVTVPSMLAPLSPQIQMISVSQLAQLLDRIDHAADVVVGVLGGTRRTPPSGGRRRASACRARRPMRERLVARGQLRVGGNDSEPLLTGKVSSRSSSHPGRTCPVLVGPFIRHMVRSVAAAGRVVDEEGLVGILCAHPVEPLDGPVGHRLREIVGVLLVVELFGRADDLLVLRETEDPTGSTRRRGSRRSSRTPSRWANGRTDPPALAARPVRCHLPNAAVLYPLSRRIRGSGAQSVEGRR